MHLYSLVLRFWFWCWFWTGTSAVGAAAVSDWGASVSPSLRTSPASPTETSDGSEWEKSSCSHQSTSYKHNTTFKHSSKPPLMFHFLFCQLLLFLFWSCLVGPQQIFGPSPHGGPGPASHIWSRPSEEWDQSVASFSSHGSNKTSSPWISWASLRISAASQSPLCIFDRRRGGICSHDSRVGLYILAV